MKPRRVARHKTCLFCSFLEALILLVEEVIFGDAHLNIWNDTRLFLNGYPPSPCSVLKWKIEPTRAAVPENSSSKRASGWLIKIFLVPNNLILKYPSLTNTLIRDSGLLDWVGLDPNVKMSSGSPSSNSETETRICDYKTLSYFERGNISTNLLADATL